VLASSFHPHLIGDTKSSPNEKANATSGQSSSPANALQDFHLIDESTPASLSALDDLSLIRDRHPLDSIPETGFGDNSQITRSHARRSSKSRKRSSSSPIECLSAEIERLPTPEESSSTQNKRGRKPLRLDMKSKLEKSRQSARECRARKKLRYQYLEELVSAREKAIFSLREELEMYKSWCKDMDEGKIPPDMKSKMEKLEKKLVLPGDERQASTSASMEEDADDDDEVDSEDDDDSDESDEDEDDEEVEKQPAGSN